MRGLKTAVVAIVLAGAAVAAAWQFSGRAAGPPAFRTEQATRGPIESAVLATGTLKPVVTVQVGSEVSGRIATLSADFNSVVGENEVIATLDPATYRARLDQAKADLAVAEATVAAKQAAVDRAEVDRQTAANTLADTGTTVDRTRRLKTSGFTTDKQLQADELAVSQAKVALDGATVEIRAAEADLAVATAQIAQAEAAVKIAETDLARTVIRSPVNGVVVNRQVDIGQTVAASLQAPVLFEIAQDLKEMRLEASVDEADIGRVAVGDAVSFTVDAFPERAFEGTVAQVRKAATVVSNVTTYTVVVTASNADETLLPGMTANVRILEARRDDVVKVPGAALRFRPEAGAAEREEAAVPGSTSGGAAGDAGRADGAAPAEEASADDKISPGKATAAVYVLGPGGRPVRRAVTTGLVSDGEVEIVAGLAAGEAVIVGRAGGAAQRRPRSPLGF